MAIRTRDNLLSRSPAGTLAVLHPVFALTGMCHSVCGPLLPSLTRTFQLNDDQAGFLLFAYFAGTSLGALLCGRRHARTLAVGFLALAIAAVAVAAANRPFAYPVFFIFGICVGVPMTAVSMYAGRTFASRSAAPLTFLNFSWSAGALLAPLFAARLLVSHTFRPAYVVLGGASVLAAIACAMQLHDHPESRLPTRTSSRSSTFRFIAVFALLTFLEVGVENTTASWLTTFVLRSGGAGVSWAAAASSLYWCGFLASRGLASLLLLRADAARMLGWAAGLGIAAGLALVAFRESAWHAVAMIILGAALAPIFPLLLARFFAQARDSADLRWVLAVCGFGGSVLPWIAGSISAHTGSLRMGLLVIPFALCLIFCTLPLIPARNAPTE